jgi:RNA polymerase sigma-70 factor (ECF subfamily)
MMPNSQRLAKAAERFEAETLPLLGELFQAASALVPGKTAESIVERTFHRAWQRFSETGEGTDYRLWLYSILVVEIRNARRPWALGWRIVGTKLTTAGSQSPAATNEVLQSLRELPQEEAEVILLCDIRDFSHHSAHQALGIPVSTVRCRLAQGRDRLTKRIGCASPMSLRELPERSESRAVGGA